MANTISCSKMGVSIKVTVADETWTPDCSATLAPRTDAATSSPHTDIHRGTSLARCSMSGGFFCVTPEGRDDLNWWEGVWYNRRRLHSSLGYMSSNEYGQVKNVA